MDNWKCLRGEVITNKLIPSEMHQKKMRFYAIYSAPKMALILVNCKKLGIKQGKL